MKILLPALFLCLICSGAMAQQSCSPSGAGGTHCSDACQICSLDGFSGVAGANMQGSLPPGFCGDTDAHPSWYAFGLQSGSISVRIDVGSCVTGSGLSMGIYRADNCSNITLASNCVQGVAANSSTILSVNNQPATTTYYLVIAGDQGAVCDFSVEVLSGIATASPLPIVSIQSQGPYCPGGIFNFTASPLSPGVTYNWELNGAPVGQGNSVNITVPAPTNLFTVCVTPSNACAMGNAVCQNYPVTPLPLLNLGTIEICQGEVFQYAGQFFSTPGLYTINTIASNGCTQPVRFFLSVINIPPVHLFETICQGDSIFVGGLSIYLEGNYSFVLTNYQGCDSIVNLTLDVLPAPIPVITGDTIACIEQTVTWTASGGSYEFSWRDATGQVLGANPLLELPDGYEGAITLSATDPTTGCEGQTTRIMQRYARPALNIIPDSAAYCGSEPIVFTTEQGYPDMLWSTGEIGLTSEVVPIFPFFYYGYYPYGNGCFLMDSAYVYISTPQVNINGDANLCAGQFATLSLDNASDILWSTGDTTAIIMVTAFADTLITVTARDAGGCLGSDTVLLSFVPALLSPTLACQNASISGAEAVISLPQDYTLDTVIVITGPAGQLVSDTYSWQGLQAGQSVVIEVRTQSPEGCLSNATIGCATLPCTTANAAISPVDILCTDSAPVVMQASLTNSVSPSAIWSGPGIADAQSGIFDPVLAGVGTHTINVTIVEAGCSAEAQTNITINEPATISDLNTSCNGDEYTLSFVVHTADTSYSYTSAPAQSGSPLIVDLPVVQGCAPIHQELLKDCNCGNSAGSFIPQAPITVCGNESLLFAPALNPVLGPGEQLFYVLHENSGNILSNIKAVYSSAPVIHFSTDLEYGKVYYLSPVVGLLLGNGQPDISYTCMDVKPGQGFVFQPQPQVTLPASQLVICEGESITLEAQTSGSTSVQWQPATGLSCATCSTTVAAPVTTTTYTIEAFNGAGCSAEASVTISIESLPSDIVLDDTISLCRGEDLDICLPDTYSYSWTGPGGFSSGSSCIALLNVDDPVQGVFSVTITSANGCTFVKQVVIDLAPEVMVSNLTPNQTVCPNQVVGLTAEVANAVYARWLPSNGLSCPACLNTLASVRRTTTYTLLVIDANGCTYEYPVTLTVDAGNCGGIITSQGLIQTEGQLEETTPELNAENMPTEANISLFPNPATSQVLLKSEDIGMVNVQLLDAQGRKCRQVFPQLAHQVTLNLDNLATGVYMVWITTADEATHVLKLMKI